MNTPGQKNAGRKNRSEGTNKEDRGRIISQAGVGRHWACLVYTLGRGNVNYLMYTDGGGEIVGE